MVEIRIGIPAVFIHQLDCFSIIVFINQNEKNGRGKTYYSVIAGLQTLQEKIKDKYELVSYNFGDALTDFKTPAYTEKETDISNAIDEVFTRHGSQNIGAVILASDGIFNKGNSPLYNRNALGIPFYTIALGDTSVYHQCADRSEPPAGTKHRAGNYGTGRKSDFK